MRPAYQDSFATLYISDALSGLAELPEQSVHMCVTSPPYFGLRSYLDKDHPDKGRELGTEATPEEFVARLVEVMRGVWRVLRDDGTLWLNIGDSYAASPSGNHAKERNRPKKDGAFSVPSWEQREQRWNGTAKDKSRLPGLKPKDLCMIPARVALALQADGWYLRSEIIWAKAVPMPESVTDRPTSATEKVFLLSKKPSYFYDSEAVKEPNSQFSTPQTKREMKPSALNGAAKGRLLGSGSAMQAGGRNQRNFWLLGPAPFPGSHFATFVPEIPLRAIRAGTSEHGVCGECGAPWRRAVERAKEPEGLRNRGNGAKQDFHTRQVGSGQKLQDWLDANPPRTVGWEPACECRTYRVESTETVGPGVERINLARPEVVPATVLDPFAGSGRTLQAARKLGRRSIGFDLDERSTEHLRTLMGSQDALL